VAPGRFGVKEIAFYEIYEHVPTERREVLRSFRLHHPYRRMSLGGLEWGYIASGSGRDAVMVLGSVTSTAESSFELISVLEQEFRVISPTYPPVTSAAILIDGFVTMLDMAGIDQVHLFGHSLGAGIAHVFVRSHPDRVNKVVLSSFGLPSRKAAKKSRRRSWLFEKLPYGTAKRHYFREVRRAYADADEGEVAFMAAYTYDRFELQHTPAGLRGRYRLVRDLIDNADVYRVGEPIERPGQVLIIQAEDDGDFAPDAQVALRDTYPGATVKVFPTGGHDVRRQNREAYDEALFDFLRG